MFEILACILILIILGVIGFTINAVPVILCLLLCPLPLIISGIIECIHAKDGYPLSDKKSGRDKILFGICILMLEVILGLFIVSTFGDALPDPWPRVKEYINTPFSELNGEEDSSSDGKDVTGSIRSYTVPVSHDEPTSVPKYDYSSNECYTFLSERFSGEISVTGSYDDSSMFITLSDTDFLGLDVCFNQLYYF